MDGLISPLKLLDCKIRNLKLENLVSIHFGMSPPRLLSPKSIIISFVQFCNEEVMWPEKLLPWRFKDSKLVRNPMEFGILPDNLLLRKSNTFNDCHLQKQSGNSPERWFPSKFINTTLDVLIQRKSDNPPENELLEKWSSKDELVIIGGSGPLNLLALKSKTCKGPLYSSVPRSLIMDKIFPSKSSNSITSWEHFHRFQYTINPDWRYSLSDSQAITEMEIRSSKTLDGEFQERSRVAKLERLILLPSFRGAIKLRLHPLECSSTKEGIKLLQTTPFHVQQSNLASQEDNKFEEPFRDFLKLKRQLIHLLSFKDMKRRTQNKAARIEAWEDYIYINNNTVNLLALCTSQVTFEKCNKTFAVFLVFFFLYFLVFTAQTFINYTLKKGIKFAPYLVTEIPLELRKSTGLPTRAMNTPRSPTSSSWSESAAGALKRRKLAVVSHIAIAAAGQTPVEASTAIFPADKSDSISPDIDSLKFFCGIAHNWNWAFQCVETHIKIDKVSELKNPRRDDAVRLDIQ
ncbi:DNA-binding storekeeper protein-relatedtranscriptional regulator, partial [Striga asiatica]